MDGPRIGITTDNEPDAPPPGRFRVSATYVHAVVRAGGVPVALPQVAELAAAYVAMCDGVMLTGGRDPRMEPFGEPTHREARVMNPSRQAFELAVLDALADAPDKPVLGICLGMQMMALHAGGRLDQHLPDTLGEALAANHRDDHRHEIHLRSEAAKSVLLGHGVGLVNTPCAHETRVVSHHHQAVADPGALRLLATAPDGVIEAIDADPESRRFYLGVQWHPERAGASAAEGEGDGAADACELNQPLIQRFVDAARATTSAR